ncbi:MAG: YjbQ family protein [Desulfobacteraceae bacterium]|jgi:secondary thiamine-phosphate synthase enzyme|nr:MAG: YjbQ family protein [Desulfobacteraceae bacterium]
MITLKVKSSKRNEMIDITSSIRGEVERSGVAEGICIVYIPHTTAGVIVNEGADPDVRLDILDSLTRLAPPSEGYRHGEGNSDSHIKAALVGSSVTIPIEQGRLALGTWQSVFFCEFDGPRSRRALIRIL